MIKSTDTMRLPMAEIGISSCTAERVLAAARNEIYRKALHEVTKSKPEREVYIPSDVNVVVVVPVVPTFEKSLFFSMVPDLGVR